MSLTKEIDQILSIGLWKFDGLPNEITIKLDNLLKNNSSAELLYTMEKLLITYIDEEKEARKCMGGSGMAGEYHMATEMRLKYLHESIEYLNALRICENSKI